MHLDRDHLAALQAILKLGSFEAAAASLGVSQPAISLRIRALEDHVGLPLIQRGTPCVGTPAGKRLGQHAETVALMEYAALRELDLTIGSTPTRVAVAVNADSLATWFPLVLKDLPDLVLDIQMDDQDHSAQWLKSGDVSAAVTGTPKPEKGCDVMPLGRQRYIATAAPEFVNKWFKDGVTADTLMRAPLITYTYKDQLQSRWMQQVTGKKLFPPTHLLPSTHGFVAATRDGSAWAMNPIQLVKKDLSNGTLVEIMPDSALDVPLFWHCNRHVKSALIPLTKTVKRIAREALLPSC